MILNRRANMKLCLSYWKRKSTGREMGFSWSILLFPLLFVETNDYALPPHTHHSLHFFLMMIISLESPACSVLGTLYPLQARNIAHWYVWLSGLSGEPGHVEVRTSLPSTSRKCKKWVKPLCAKLFANFQIMRLHVCCTSSKQCWPWQPHL